MRLSSFVTDPLGRSATCSYNADDHVTSTTDRDGRRTTFSYDSGGRETGETWYDSSGQVTGHITLTYDNTGRMTGADDPNALLTFTYDSGGNQLTQATSGPGTGQPDVTLTSAYDGNNNRTSLADNLSTSNTITYDYDLANRMTTIGFSASTGSYAVAFGYDSGGNVTSVDRLAPSMFGLGNPTTTTIAYDAANRVTTMTDYSYTTSMSGGTTTPLATYLYGYDNANRVTSETDKEGLVTFSYDSGGQLLTARGSRTENYSYDSGGNRNMTGYTTGTGNELTSGGGYTFTYDNEGNMTGETQLSTGDGWTFGYDNRNRMVAAEEKSSGGTILCQVSYTYDAENRRIGEDVNGTQTWTAYDGVNPYADFNGAGTLQDRYLMGAAVDEVLGRIDASGGVAWYLTDRLGSVRDIVNTTGTVLDHIVYDSFGNIVTETNSANGDRFKYTGMEYDSATGQYYDRARYYDEAIGSFTSRDPTGFQAGSANLYEYVGNSPANGRDPSGTDASMDYMSQYPAILAQMVGQVQGGMPTPPSKTLPQPNPDPRQQLLDHLKRDVMKLSGEVALLKLEIKADERDIRNLQIELKIAKEQYLIVDFVGGTVGVFTGPIDTLLIYGAQWYAETQIGDPLAITLELGKAKGRLEAHKEALDTALTELQAAQLELQRAEGGTTPPIAPTPPGPGG